MKILKRHIFASLFISVLAPFLAGAAGAASESEIVANYYAAFHPETSTARVAARASAKKPDGTLALLGIIRSWRDFSPQTRGELGRYFTETGVAGRTGEREAMLSSGSCASYLGSSPASRQSQHFIIYYTTDAASQDKVDSASTAGTPNYISNILGYAEEVWRHEIEKLGFDAPPLNNGKYPIYICDIVGRKSMLGLTVTDAYFANFRARSYIELDNDYANVRLSGGVTLAGMIEVTFAHEFFHAIQFGLNWRYPSYWVLESTATWMEDEVYPDVNDYVIEYLAARFNNSDLPLDHFSYNDIVAYGSSIYWRYITEKIGGSSAMKTIWDSIENDRLECYHTPCAGVGDDEITEIPLIEQYLTSSGYAFDSVFINYTTANYLKQYVDGALSIFPQITPAAASTVSSGSLDHLATKYYSIAAPSGQSYRLTFSFNGNTSTTWSARLLLTRAGGGSDIRDVPLASETGTVGIEGWGSTYTGAIVIISNLGKTPDYNDKAFAFDSSTVPTCSTTSNSPALASGWNLVAFPVIASSPDPSQSAGIAAGDIWYADPVTGQLYMYGQSGFTGLGVPGVGYWVYRNAPGALSVTGCAVTGSSIDVQLKKGWNLIGSPFSAAAPWADSNIRILLPGDTAQYTLSQAAGQGWISSTAYEYSGGNYTARPGNTGFSFSSWAAYWVVSKRDLTLRFFQ